jgi:hypothetical protein
MIETYASTLNYSVANNSGYIKTPNDVTNEFQLQGPVKLNLSGALILGRKAILSAEYNYSNYKATRLMSSDGDIQLYSTENDAMSTSMSDLGMLKVGAEFKVNDNFSIRGGYANSKKNSNSTAQKNMFKSTVRTDSEYFLHNSTNYFTAGFGYRESNWFVDVAIVNKIDDQSFYPYNSNKLAVVAQPASVITTNNNVLVSLGFKF